MATSDNPRGTLIRIAAQLVRGDDGLPSDDVEDHDQKSYSANRVANIVSEAREIAKLRGINIRDAAYALWGQIDKLAAFKKYVHDRLDGMGVPHDPDPEHNAEHGCRIEGRLNYLLQRAERAEAACAEKDEAIREAMEWNWLDDEADPPSESVAKINRALSADTGRTYAERCERYRFLLGDAVTAISRLIACAEQQKPPHPSEARIAREQRDALNEALQAAAKAEEE